MWLKAQNEMAGFWPHAAMGPVERMVRPRYLDLERWGIQFDVQMATETRTSSLYEWVI